MTHIKNLPVGWELLDKAGSEWSWGDRHRISRYNLVPMISFKFVGECVCIFIYALKIYRSSVTLRYLECPIPGLKLTSRYQDAGLLEKSLTKPWWRTSLGFLLHTQATWKLPLPFFQEAPWCQYSYGSTPKELWFGTELEREEVH